MRELRRKKEELGHMIEKRRKCQEEKEMLEFELMKAQFHLDHLPYRKEMAATDTSMRMVFLVPLIIIVVNYIIVFIKMVHYINKGELDRANGFTLLIAAVVVPFGAILIFRLFRQQYSNIGSFFKLGNLFNNMGTDTFEEDRQKTLKQISSLLTKISDLEEDIDQQREQEKKFRVEIERYKESLIEAGLFDARELQKSKKPDKKTYSYQIIEPVMTKGQLEEALGSIDREIEQIEAHIKELNEKDDEFAWQQQCIDAKYKKWTSDAKHLLIFFVCIVMIQKLVELFSDVFTTLVAGVGMTVTLIGIYRLFKSYKDMLIPGLIENENDLVGTYVFQYGIVPVKQQRFENNKELKRYKQKLINARDKKIKLQDENEM